MIVLQKKRSIMSKNGSKSRQKCRIAKIMIGYENTYQSKLLNHLGV